MPALGAIVSQGHAGVDAHVADSRQNKASKSQSMDASALKSAPPATVSMSSAIAKSVATLSTSIDKTLSSLETLSTSVASLASGSSGKSQSAQARHPSMGVFKGQGNGLAKFASPSGTAMPATGSAGGSGVTGSASTSPAGSAEPTSGLMTDLAVVDFGTLKINGVSNYLGSVQAPYMSSTEAAQYVVGAINSNEKNTVTASLNDQDAIVLTSKDGSAINIEMGGSTTGDLSQLIDTGLASGSYDGTVTASKPITSPLFAENFEATFQSLSAPPSSSTTTQSGTTSTGGSTATAEPATTEPATATSRPTPRGWLKKDA